MNMKYNYAKLLITNFTLVLIIELVFKLFVMGTFDIGIFYIFIFSFLTANLWTFLSCLSKRKNLNKIINLTFLFIFSLIVSAITVYYSFYKTICGFSAIIYGEQVMDFASSILAHIKSNVLIIIILFIPFIVMLILSLKNVFSYSKKYGKDAISLLVCAFLFSLTAIELNLNNSESIHDLVYKKNDLMQTANNLGLAPALGLDAFKCIFKFEGDIEVSNIGTFTKDSGVEYNITSIDFSSLREKTHDTTIKNMHTYFENTDATNKNEYTGIFSGKNLIFIVAEGFYPIAVSEELTPTLYKLANSSFIFDNYYQPIYNCSTSDGEFINQLSILPGVETCSMKATISKYLPYSLGNILKNYGYKANAFHGWTYNYYSRDKIMPNLGYTYYGYDRYKRGYKYALKGIKDSWPTSDIDVINASYDIYAKEERFITYYMSISGHLEYNFTGGNAIASKNKSLVSGLDASDAIKAYIATQIEFDKSMELLLKKLEDDGILDDTVIVVSPDHYPYGLSSDEIKNYVDWIKNPNFDLYKNNLIIYNSKVSSTHVSKYTSSLDLLPTLLNLFGVEYDSRLLIGRDIFSNSDDLVIFNNKSWITSKGRYDYLKRVFEPFDGNDVSDDYINKINNIVDMKFQMSKLLVKKDYYRTLGGK